MLLLPRNWASKSLNPAVFFAVFCFSETFTDLVGSKVTGDGINLTRYVSASSLFSSLWQPSKPGLLLWLPAGWKTSSAQLTLVCWTEMLLWRRFCLAMREPWESSLALFLLFFLSFFTGALTHRLRFLTQKNGTTFTSHFLCKHTDWPALVFQENVCFE